MTQYAPIHLRPRPVKDGANKDLEDLIKQISQQNGSFRDVSETSLEQQIRDEALDKDAAVEASDESDVNEEDLAKPAGNEDMLKAREELLRQVSQARNESAMALDFMSLVLSKKAPLPSPGNATMSSYLQQHVPTGSLGAENVQAPQLSRAERNQRELVSMGWRVRSLSGAADSLLASAGRLEDEITKEVKYWDGVMTVKDSGWSVCRMPRERHTLAVRYGFAESGLLAYADFQNRSLAALRRDDDGNLTLDRGLRAKGNHRRLQVRILEAGRPVASSRPTSSRETSDEKLGIADDILAARDSLFDEELHMELHREARLLLSHRVRCHDGKVLLPLVNKRQIEVDLIDASSTEEEDDESEMLPDAASESLSILLRLLLSRAHAQNLADRSGPPAPIRGGTRPRPVFPIIKPLIDAFKEGKDSIAVLCDMASDA